eukprot:CAMPEP_0206231022 /NCGR_PEP_ID=MMETSP0047_2-20121206/10604_1 /ASSEMBLY_ACC=CAM_ASM_000192 /TAXON_ID=195065 /ORGANISM="Chroomonas mesostigmatica_cf, Strain CCMP1168" /LENGTH=116 /DNA_ID=CAMNT_0053654551 /DNA_START=337 /DNA_END=684 /DNA_ORIENTATION=-
MALLPPFQPRVVRAAELRDLCCVDALSARDGHPVERAEVPPGLRRGIGRVLCPRADDRPRPLPPEVRLDAVHVIRRRQVYCRQLRSAYLDGQQQGVRQPLVSRHRDPVSPCWADFL